MDSTLAILLVVALPLLCWLAYRAGRERGHDAGCQYMRMILHANDRTGASNE